MLEEGHTMAAARMLFLGALLSAMAGPVAAAPPDTTRAAMSAALAQLRSGQTLRLETRMGGSLTGRLEVLEGDSLALSTGQARTMTALADVRPLRRRHRSSL